MSMASVSAAQRSPTQTSHPKLGPLPQAISKIAALRQQLQLHTLHEDTNRLDCSRTLTNRSGDRRSFSNRGGDDPMSRLSLADTQPRRAEVSVSGSGITPVYRQRGRRVSEISRLLASRTSVTSGSSGGADSDSLGGAEVKSERRLRLSNSIKTKKVQRRRKDLLDKFRLVARVAIFCTRCAKSTLLSNKTYDDISPYICDVHFHDYESIFAGVDLMFDPGKFKANKQLRLSEEAKRVLSMHTSERKDKELYGAQIALRNMQSFAEYPVGMQRKIVEVGVYHRFDTKRVIVRQFQPAAAFYFILSGLVVVMVSAGETKVAQPVAYLSRGMTFGELAIVNRTNRQSTCIAKTPIELLSIDIDDFHRIFMSGDVNTLRNPDYQTFIGSIGFLRGWPLELLDENPRKCIFHYFKQGEVLVRDTNYSDWIYIVKSGSLRVLKKLKRVTPFEGFRHSAHAARRKSEQRKAEHKVTWESQRRWILHDLRVPLKDVPDQTYFPDINADPRPHELPKMDQAFHLRLPGNTQHAARYTGIPRVKNGADFKRSKSKPNTHAQSETEMQSGGETDNEESPVELDRKTRIKKRKNAVVKMSKSTSDINNDGIEFDVVEGEDDNMFEDVEPEERRSLTPKEGGEERGSPQMEGDRRGRSGKKRRKISVIKQIEQEEEREMHQELKGRKQEIRTIIDDLDSAYKNKKPTDLTPADIDPQFVNVQTLTRGNVFGIAETVLGDQPSFCVVSSGAECILLNKAFYMKHASERLLRRVRGDCCPYPTDSELQASLQVQIDWQAYKSATFRTTMKDIHGFKSYLSGKQPNT